MVIAALSVTVASCDSGIFRDLAAAVNEVGERSGASVVY